MRFSGVPRAGLVEGNGGARGECWAVATADDVRRIALSLPETDEHPSYGGRPSFRVRKKGFASLDDDGETCGIWVESFEDKEALLGSDARKFFTTPHYDGYLTV